MHTRGFRSICIFVAAVVTVATGPGPLAQEPATPQPTQPAPASPQAAQPAPGETSAPTGQQPVSQATQAEAPAQNAPAASQPASGPAPFVLASGERGRLAIPVSEQNLRQQLQGKTFYLRGGYLDNPLHFDEQGHLDGNSPQASYTLSLVEIERVKLEKRRVVLEGVRYGLHFLGARPTEDQTAAVDKVRLTAKKKPLEITIDREAIVKPKREKESKPKSTAQVQATTAQGGPDGTQPSPQDTQQSAAEGTRHGDAVATTEGHANQTLTQALDRVFASGIDDRMIATLPDYWKLFYKAVAEHRDYKPSDPGVLPQSAADQKAKLISVFEPPSNEYAQNNGVAGIAMYHVVVGSDGKPSEIAVGRPIGFGLDENAVKSIRQATFQPAMKDGKAVPVMLDLLVQFRIYSKRTAASNSPEAAAPEPAKPEGPVLPGPYTANAPKTDAQPAADTTQQPAPDAGQPAPDQQAPSTTTPAQPSQPQTQPPSQPQPQA